MASAAPCGRWGRIVPPLPPSSNRIVAVGLLTQRDVEVLGAGFHRLFAVEPTADFDDLLRRLDACEVQAVQPLGPR